MALIMIEAILDSNILLLHIGGRERLSFEPKSVGISTLTVFECLRFPGLSAEEEMELENLISLCEVVSVSHDIAKAAAINARTRPKERPIDQLIAATALMLDIPLITKNVKDFRGIPGLIVKMRLSEV